MNESYADRKINAHERLVTLLNPTTDLEHRMVAWLLGMLMPAEVDVFSGMIERSSSTAARAVAQLTLDYWEPGESASNSAVNVMQRIANGGRS